MGAVKSGVMRREMGAGVNVVRKRTGVVCGFLLYCPAPSGGVLFISLIFTFFCLFCLGFGLLGGRVVKGNCLGSW